MIGQLLDGRYQIVRELGAGAFGQTYIAEDIRRYNCKCVVKQLKPYANDPYTLQVAKRLFDDEAETLHRLGSHNQIPQLLAHFEENQEFYLVQEFIDGHPLDREITPGKQLSESYAIAFLQGILEPLSFVHQQGVIHRDIKPANLMRRDSDHKIVLIDFGAVKQVAVTQVLNAQGTTKLSVAIGTEGYMPSEQSRGIPRFSSDIYAVGMTAIYALAGMPPDQLPEDIATAEIRWDDRVQISQGLAEILERMVRYDFRQRYPSATEVLQAIQLLASPHTPTIPPIPPVVLPQYHVEGISQPQLSQPTEPNLPPSPIVSGKPIPTGSPLTIGLLAFSGIGILAAVTIPLLNQQATKSRQADVTIPLLDQQATKSRQAEAETYVSTLNKGQQAFFTEKGKFTNDIESLGVGIRVETENYSFKTILLNELAVQNVGLAKKEGLRSYTGIVWIGTTTNPPDITSNSIFCESDQPTTQSPPSPVLPKLPSTTPVSCPSGYLQVGR
jgi:serine/threonine protein kinase